MSKFVDFLVRRCRAATIPLSRLAIADLLRDIRRGGPVLWLWSAVVALGGHATVVTFGNSLLATADRRAASLAIADPYLARAVSRLIVMPWALLLVAVIVVTTLLLLVAGISVLGQGDADGRSPRKRLKK